MTKLHGSEFNNTLHTIGYFRDCRTSYDDQIEDDGKARLARSLQIDTLIGENTVVVSILWMSAFPAIHPVLAEMHL